MRNLSTLKADHITAKALLHEHLDLVQDLQEQTDIYLADLHDIARQIEQAERKVLKNCVKGKA